VGYLDNLRAFGEEQRTIAGAPWQPWNNPFWKFSQGGPAHPSRQINGVDDALGLPALYAGSKLLADGVASLPIKVYQKYNQGGYGKHKLYEGPSFFDKPSIVGSQYDWLFTCITSLVLHGNAWGFITGRDGYGLPTGIEWIPPEDVVVEESYERKSANPLDARVYVRGVEVDWRRELFHVRAFTLPGRLEAVSPLRAFALTFTSGREAMQYGYDWYQSGGFPPGTFQNAEIEIDSDQAAEIRKSLVTSLRRREPLVYGRDWDYKPVTVPPSEAQFIDAIQLNATQIAAILNVPPDRIGGSKGDSLTYSTAEQSTLQIIEALRPWLVRLEQAFFDVLPRNRFARFYTDALLKTDLESRMNIYQIQRNIGIRTADEIRELEDLPPLPGGIGSEAMPLTLMNALGTRAGAIPKSIMKAVVLEMDLAAERLFQLESTNVPVKLVTPPAPKPAAPAKPAGSSSKGTNSTATSGRASVPGDGDGDGIPNEGSGNSIQGAKGAAGGAIREEDIPPGSTSKMVPTPIGMPLAAPPFTQDPASYLASMITMQRDMSLPEETRNAAAQTYLRVIEKAMGDNADEVKRWLSGQAPMMRNPVIPVEEQEPEDGETEEGSAG